MDLFVYLMLLTPSLFGNVLFNKLVKRNIIIKDFVRIFVYFFISNVLSMFTIYLIKGYNINLIYSLGEYSYFALKYYILLFFYNMFISYINAFLSKNFDISIEDNSEKN